MINKYILIALVIASSAFSATFYDDFEDDDISDWEARCASANWYASGGIVHGTTNSSPGILIASEGLPMEDGYVTVRAAGVHAFGICARFDETNTGIIGYVSPDHDVARIRRVINGSQEDILNSLVLDFPGGVWYELTLEMNGPDVSLQISVPSTGDTWYLTATDPYPHPGLFGFHMGEEPNGQWDWIEVQGNAVGEAYISWFTTEDNTAGDGDMCLEPGETIQLGIELTNASDAPIENAFGILQSLDPELVITENYVDYQTIAGQGSSYGTGEFSVMAPLVTPADQCYDLRLTVMADGGYHEQLNFELPVGYGVETDVESGSAGWTWGAAATGWQSDWHVSTTRNHTSGGEKSFKCGSTGSGDYSDHQFSYLQSPYINFPRYGDVSFWSWIEAQVMSSSIAYDGGILQYRRLNEWVDIAFVPGYSHQINSGSTGPFADATPVYSGTVGWTEYTWLIPDELAGPGEFRFVFGSDNAGNREGWYIDDILVTGPSSTADPSTSPVLEPFLSVTENPVQGAVLFQYMMPGSTGSQIEIFDLSGRLLDTIPIPACDQPSTVSWNGTEVAGLYLARIAGTEMNPVRLVKL